MCSNGRLKKERACSERLRSPRFTMACALPSAWALLVGVAATHRILFRGNGSHNSISARSVSGVAAEVPSAPALTHSRNGLRRFSLPSSNTESFLNQAARCLPFSADPGAPKQKSSISMFSGVRAVNNHYFSFCESRPRVDVNILGTAKVELTSRHMPIKASKRGNGRVPIPNFALESKCRDSVVRADALAAESRIPTDRKPPGTLCAGAIG